MKIGIDIGGSHIAVGVIENENIIEKYEIDIIENDNVKEFIENTIINQLNNFLNKYSIEYIGIAVPGIVENQQILGLFNLGIGKYDIISSLKSKINLDIPIIINNDGVCAAITEMKYGSLKRFYNSIFLCLGTGIGGAICINGKVIPSNEILNSEFGHIQMNYQENIVTNNKCKCGKNDCFEIYGSIKNLKKNLLNAIKGENISIEDYSGEELHNLIMNNTSKKEVIEIVEKYIKDIVYGISKIVNLTNPQAVCLGGGFWYYKDLLFDKFMDEFLKGEFINKEIEIPVVVLAKFQNNAGMIGA